MTAQLNDVIINGLESIKADDIVCLDVRDLTDVMDTIIVASGSTGRQVRALANAVVADGKKAGYPPIGVEGMETAEWVLVDFADTVVHIMLPTTRVFYDLEKLWSMKPGELTQIAGDPIAGPGREQTRNDGE